MIVASRGSLFSNQTLGRCLVRVGTTDGSFGPVVGTQTPTTKEAEVRESEVSYSFFLQ
jgi:hypothetical protein